MFAKCSKCGWKLELGEFQRFNMRLLRFCPWCGEKYVASPDGAESPAIEVETEAGSFVDERDGRTYRTVRIGDQVWMAENLDYGRMVPGYRDELAVGEKWCYDNNEALGYGGLYTQETALASCPKGWHVPTDDEWRTLTQTLGGGALASLRLRSKTDWLHGCGNDVCGFSALPAGQRRVYDDRTVFSDAGLGAYFWLADARKQPDIIRFNSVSVKPECAETDGLKRKSGCSVRCVKD